MTYFVIKCLDGPNRGYELSIKDPEDAAYSVVMLARQGGVRYEVKRVDA